MLVKPEPSLPERIDHRVQQPPAATGFPPGPDPDRYVRADTWTLTDGNAGNVRQAEALAAALGHPSRAVTVQARPPWRWLAPRRLPGSAHAFDAGFARALDQPPTLAIGCGRQAALATRLLAGRGARSVQILDPRIDPRHWDLVIAPEHDGLRGGNVISLLGSLNPIDDLWLAAARQRFPAIGELPGPRTALLVGGPSPHAAWDPAFFDDLFSRLRAMVEREGGSVLASTSRRTPASVRRALAARLGGLPGIVWCSDEDGENPYAGLLGWADRIVCTADSVNMVSEACATLATVFAAGLAQLQGRPRRFADSLLGRDRLRPFDDRLATYAVTPLRETARVAAEVQARLGRA